LASFLAAGGREVAHDCALAEIFLAALAGTAGCFVGGCGDCSRPTALARAAGAPVARGGSTDHGAGGYEAFAFVATEYFVSACAGPGRRFRAARYDAGLYRR
jgi:hypothetical protein